MAAIDVWLTKRNLSIRCMVIDEDETAMFPQVRSLNLRGAQREITRSLAVEFQPVGRWHYEHPQETVRLFRPKGTS